MGVKDMERTEGKPRRVGGRVGMKGRDKEGKLRRGKGKECARDEQGTSYSLFPRKKIAGSISACSQLGGQLVVPREVTRSRETGGQR